MISRTRKCYSLEAFVIIYTWNKILRWIIIKCFHFILFIYTKILFLYLGEIEIQVLVTDLNFPCNFDQIYLETA